MNLKTINDCISQYKNIIKCPDYNGWRLWELTAQFQENWDMDASRLQDIYKASFEINSPLWHRDFFYPKKAMERYININEDLAKAIFKDLLNEKKDLTQRINRFIFQCDLLYKLENDGNEKAGPHYHANKEMIFTYLAFKFPDQYSLYNFLSFKTFMDKVGSKYSPQEEDIDRFVKVCHTLSVLIQKDEELVKFVSNKVYSFTNGKLYPMLMVFELYALVDEYK
ncbi:MAG: hypothetical protein V3V00_03235 [Saprospiraceae bacterium]